MPRTARRRLEGRDAHPRNRSTQHRGNRRDASTPHTEWTYGYIPPTEPRLFPLDQLQPGTVILAEVPYSDGTGSKVRPAVIVDCDPHADTLSIRPITSSANRHAWGAWEVEDRHSAGLGTPSGVATKILEIPRRTHVHLIKGQLADTDWAGIQDLPTISRRAPMRGPQPAEVQAALGNHRTPTLAEARALLGLPARDRDLTERLHRPAAALNRHAG